MGRPTKQTPETVKAIIHALEGGNTRTDAVLAVGISLDSLARWCKDAEFSGLIEKAEATGRQRLVEQIVWASRRNWTAAAWMLERRWPDVWGKRERVDMVLDVRRAVEQITSDPDEVEAAVAEAKRLMNVR